MSEKRTRRRNAIDEDKRAGIAARAVELYNTEWGNRGAERDARLQRYAKYRLWSQGTDWPWQGASDQAIPDMLQDSLRVQDTLVNAVMSQRPPVVSRANAKGDAEKQEAIDRLIEYQVFVENQACGGDLIGDLAESFVNDPAAIVFIPWVRDKRQTADIRVYDPIPESMNVRDYFFDLLRARYPSAKSYDESAAGWEWTVVLPKGRDSTEELQVSFYTDEDGEVEMCAKGDAVVFDGPRVTIKDYDDVFWPAQAANLQMPGPSNPNGAAYVILRDFPTVAEVKTLIESGYYDLAGKEEAERFGNAAAGQDGKQESLRQKDRLQGVQQPLKPKDASHGRLTRLTCFDLFDIDGDGIEEDVIFWVIAETKTLLKARLLIDMYPSSPPRRPLISESYLPVGGRAAGMSLLEIEEAVHDAVKVLVDQTINATDLAIASPGWYRPASGMNPEALRIEPFTLSPLQNPQQDVVFPQIGNPNAMGTALNMITMLGNWQEKLTMVSDLSFGQVPAGSSSALRTIGGMSMVQGQGEARPERILRRFFNLLTGMWRQIHILNQSFLPKGKQFRIAGYAVPNQDPYRKIDSPNEIAGDFGFEFDANVLNTSKAALQNSLEALLKTYVNPLMIQLGVTTPDGIYRMARDYGRAYGQNVDQYITPPTPEAAMPKILAEDAILAIMNTSMPEGVPMEPGGPPEHLQKLAQFAGSLEFGLLNAAQVEIFKAYLQQVQKLLAQGANAQMLAQNAQAFAQTRNQGSPGAPMQTPPQVPSGPPRINGPTEMMNENLPTAGGGAAKPNGAANV